ncbi:MAG: beta-N-acetylhexosaminidase [Acidiferrobacterales bacterium]|nr:beta-N-acetylhexosaminidase [Acidiferrobacterales bacterium]
MSPSDNQQLGPVMTAIAGRQLSATDRERLLSPIIGGVVLFDRNYESPEQMRHLADEIHALRSPALLIAVDQEGGRVQRLKTHMTRLPPQAVYGRIYDENPDFGCDVAEFGGYLMATQVLETGIDISFSPVLDVVTTQSEVIGDRAFHSDPNAVALLAESWIRGMQKAGMKSVGKHFPGHGGVAGDTHFECPEDNRSIQEILNCDLVPYRRLGERLSSVMTAHVLYPDCTSAIPTYSSFWLDHMLREVLAFYGPIFSDDLSMSAAEEAGDIDTRLYASLTSGCDIALICQSESDTDKAIDHLTKNSYWRDPTWQYAQLKPDTADTAEQISGEREKFLEIVDHYKES